MRDIAHRVGARGERECKQAVFADIEQFVFDAIAAIAGVEDATDDDEVLLCLLPESEIDLGAAGRALRTHVSSGHRPELTRARQIRTHHFSDIRRRRRTAALIRHVHHCNRQGRSVAANDIDLKPALLGQCSDRQQQYVKETHRKEHLDRSRLDRQRGLQQQR